MWGDRRDREREIEMSGAGRNNENPLNFVNQVSTSALCLVISHIITDPGLVSQSDLSGEGREEGKSVGCL